jgi:hypothetical protein
MKSTTHELENEGKIFFFFKTAGLGWTSLDLPGLGLTGQKKLLG